MKRTATKLAALVLCVGLAGAAFAAAPSKQAEAAAKPAIQLGAPFCDNMVLQRGMKVPVWGWRKPGDTITVEFAGQKRTAKAGPSTGSGQARWTVWLDPLKASFEPAEMVIKVAGKTVVLKNILVGEVWMASGQSNMQWLVNKSSSLAIAQALGEEQEAKGLKVAPIREFEVTSVVAMLHPIEKAAGAWKNGDYTTYSAIAFAFAHKLYKELDVPIGILNCSFSQTSIQSWVPREGWATATDDYSKAINQKCLATDPTTPEFKTAWDAFYTSLETQIAQSEAAIKAGDKANSIAAGRPGNLQGNRDANWLFNGRMNPVVPFAIKGAIWNQGYANMNEGFPYYHNLHSLIRGWRIVWDKPELPVYFHQFYSSTMRRTGQENNTPIIGGESEMRLGTWMARDIPNAGMASQIDITGGIHYRSKAVPGQRLALHALKNQYGQKDLVVDGPMYNSYTVKGNKLIVEFDEADGGLVVGKFNPASSSVDIIENGADKVKLFYIADENRVFYPATLEIDGNKAILTSPKVKTPCGVSYASAGVGFQPNLYNQALLPATPFVFFDHEMVLSSSWPDGKLKVDGLEIDPNTVGKLYEYRKMPLLSVQFRDNAVFQADKPVTIWGTTRMHGEWQSEPEAGDCKVHFEFGDIKKVIAVTPEMDEWKVTLPPMEAGPKPYTLKVHFTVDGEIVHERTVPGIVFGDVWCVVAPALPKGAKFELPAVEPSGQIVRMIQNQSKRDGRSSPSRFSICTSRTRAPMNRFAAYWKDAEGLAAVLGNRIAAKTGRPVGIIYLKAKKDIPIKNWIAPSFLKDAPSLMEDYKTVGSQYPDNPYYLANVRRYIGDWQSYWGEFIPQMMTTKAVPDGAAWGSYPSATPDIGDSTATYEYNVYMHSLTPATLSGIVFITGEAMVADGGANFAPEMVALARSFKTRFALQPGPSGAWQNGDLDIPFIYTQPSKTLSPAITVPKGIKGKAVAVEVSDWTDLTGVIEAAVKQGE